MQPSRKEECITEIKEQEAWLEKQKDEEGYEASLAYNPDELHRALLKFKSGDKVKIIIVKQ